MEIVILDDMQATYLTTWVRLANTAGHEAIKPGDEFQENGALEEFSVEATSFSPVPGASRIRLLRAHHATKSEVHKAGAVLRKTNFPAMAAGNGGSAEPMELASPLSGTTAIAASTGLGGYPLVSESDVPDPAKRGRGRPKGSPNKPKQPLVPVWPGVT